MSKINALDISEIADFPKMSESNGKGLKLDNAVTDYVNALTNVSNAGFYSDDSSTAHAVIDSLNTQMTIIQSVLENLNSLFDNAIDTIQEEIIDEEDSLAASITGG